MPRHQGARPEGRGRDGVRPQGGARPEQGRSPTAAGGDLHRDKRRPPKAQSDPDTALIWGFHSVREALRSERRTVLRLHATAAAATRLEGEVAARGLSPLVVTAEEIAARLPRDAVHQGVLLEARPLPPLEIDGLTGEGLVIVLDQVTDPHNVGAILRTAAAFGVTALVTTERHAPERTGVLAKAASGGLEHVAVVSVVNLARAMEHLGDLGYLRVGLDSDASVALTAVEPSGAVALVFGAEGKGLRRLTRENCDVIARLDMPGPVKSLNVSNACAAALTVLHLRAASNG